MSDELEPIIDETGEERRCGSLLPPQGFVSSFRTFETEHPVWDDAKILKAIRARRKPKRQLFGPKWVQDQKSHGCHDDQTEVLTDRGWKFWTEYNWQDKLATVNPVDHSLEYQIPIQKHEYDYDGVVYRANHRGLDFGLTPNHRMYHRRWNESQRTLKNEYEMREIADIGWYAGLLAAPSGFVGCDLKNVAIENGRNYSGDDFIALLSLVVSDGWAGSPASEVKNQVSFCCFLDSRYTMVSALAERTGFKELPGRKGVWICTDRWLAEYIRKHCYAKNEYRAWNKCVPDIIHSCSARQIKIWLRFFGDQNHSDGCDEVYYSSSKTLIDGIQSLLLKVGKCGRISERQPKTAVLKDGREIVGRRVAYCCYVQSTDKLSITRKNDIEKDWYKGPVFCATVPNGTLITRRSGKMLISGNSCNGYAGAGAYAKARYLRGYTDGKLFSGAFLYSLINGGRDQGSSLESGLKALQKTGVCEASTVTWDMIYPRMQPANAKTEAAEHLGYKCYAVQSRQGFRTAVAAGFPVIVAVHAGRNFQRLSNGIAGVDNGPGNHAVHVDDISLIDGKECYDMQNSWNLSYGENGRAWLTWDSFEQTFGKHTFYAIPSTEEGDG